MRVSELRKLLGSYQEEELRYLIVELYKSIPKSVKESKDLDLLIRAAKENAHMGKKEKLDGDAADVNQLQLEIELFLENVYQQYYIEPNRVIPKQERPKWRFKVKHYVKHLQTISVESEHGQTATDLLEKLYEMLCLACIYTLFRTENPFQSIGISQEEFLDMLLKRVFSYGMNREAIQKALSLVFQRGLEREIGHDKLFEVLIKNLKTIDSKEIAIEEAVTFQEYLKKEKESNIQESGKRYYDEIEEEINQAVEFIFRLKFSLCEYDEGIAYFKKYYHDGDEQFSIHPLLQLLYSYDKPKLWIQEYELAKWKKLGLGKRIQECYEVILETGKFPERYY